ncbi:MAG: hypothetical protein IT204_21140 [Fimbriimonadaceae bacterium]|nr:hypothetical protein [Fimbriimonadaceae bacterium]
MPTFNGLNTAMFQVTVIDGAAAATALTVSGIAPADVLLMVLHQDSTGLLLADLTNEASITAVDTVQLSSTATTGDKLVVAWLDLSQPER